MRSFLRCLALCGLLVSTPCPAADAPPTSAAQQDPSNREQAKGHFERGIKEFRAKHYKDAIDAFLLAYDLYPSAAISFNIARAYESLQYPSGALRFYRDYLRRDPGASDAAQISKRIDDLEDRLRQLGVQQVTIRSNPPGATLSVDGRAVGITPWTGDVLPGDHGVELALRGYESQLGHFELSSHRAAELEFQLQAVPKAPSTASEPEPAKSAPEAAPSAAPPVNAAPQPLSPAPVPPEPRSTFRSVLPWATLGAGTLALAGAGYFELASARDEDRARREPKQGPALDAVESMKSSQLTARVLLGVGGTLAATGGVLLWLDPGTSEKPGQVALSCGLASCAVQGKF
jgi:tetratricopeptide (TPR) repeat protein